MIEVPSPNPLYYIVPPPPGGPFTQADIQNAVAYSLQNSVNQANQQEATEYALAWAAYKQARDNNNGNPVANVPEPTPSPSAALVRDKEGNPGWFVDIAKPVVPVNIYVPPAYHPNDPLVYGGLVHQAPPGDIMPVGYEYTDTAGQWGPAGTTWVKTLSHTPFGDVFIYIPKQG